MLAVFLGAVAILTAYLLAFFPGSPSALAPWVMAAGIVLLLISLMLLGARRRGRAPRPLLVCAIVLVGLIVLGSFVAALALPAEAAGARLLLGLPRRAALVVYGVGVLPALILPLAYALSFEGGVLSEAELRELRSRLVTPESEQRSE